MTLDGQKTITRNQVKCCDLIGSRKFGTQETLDGLETLKTKKDIRPRDYWVNQTREACLHHHSLSQVGELFFYLDLPRLNFLAKTLFWKNLGVGNWRNSIPILKPGSHLPIPVLTTKKVWNQFL